MNVDEQNLRIQSIELLDDWRNRCRESQHKHYGAADQFGRYGKMLTVPATVISAMVASGLAIALDHQSISQGLKIAGAVLSASAAILTAIETALEYTKRAEQHRSAAARYAGLRREIESLIAQPPEVQAELRIALAVIREKMNSLAELSPGLPPKLWNAPMPDKSKPHDSYAAT